METLFVPGEEDFKRWIKEALIEYFKDAPEQKTEKKFANERVLSRKDAMDIFGISSYTLLAWVANGLVCYRENRRVFFLQSEILEYLKNNKQKDKQKF